MKRGTDSHASDIGHWLGMTPQKAGAGNGSDIGHWLGMTPLRGVRGDAPQGYLLRCVGIAPYERTKGAMVKWTAGGVPQGHSFRCGNYGLK